MPFRFPSRLYPIVDSLPLAEAVMRAGVRLVQLRVKDPSTRRAVEIARAVKAAADARGVRLIVNDRADIARLVDAAGVHLGQDDLPPAEARAQLGPEKIIGFSTHTRAQLAAAVRAGVADYVAFGPIFPTRSKERPDPAQGVEALRVIRGMTTLPLVAIGGITADTVSEVLAAGADAAALIGAIANAPDPAAATRQLLVRAGSPE